MRTGTHRDFQFCSKSHCFACKKHWEGLGPIEKNNSGAIHAVLHARNDRWGLGTIETYNSMILFLQNGMPSIRITSFYGFKPSCVVLGCKTANFGAVLHAHNNRWCLGPIEICYSGPIVAVLHAKTTDEGWDLQRLVNLMLIMMFCLHKVTGEVWDP